MTTLRSTSSGHVTVALDRGEGRAPVRVVHPVGSVHDTCLWVGFADEEVVAVLSCSEAIAISEALRNAAGAPNHHDAGYRKGRAAGQDQERRLRAALTVAGDLLREKDARIKELELAVIALTEELNEGPWSW